MRLWVGTVLLTMLLTPGWVGNAASPRRMIYDDDCSQDVDCAATLPILQKLAERGEIRILAMIADSANPLTAPVMKIFAQQGGRPRLPIGANQTDEPASELCAKNKCNDSDWAGKLVERFDPGDSRERYPDCVTVYRKALANQPRHSVAIVETGFATCLNQLLASNPDAISPLSGEELVKHAVKLLSIMGGKYPAGTEWNFECDAAGYHALLVRWTRQKGFPPVYLNGYANGENVLAGMPASVSAKVNPTVYAMELSGVKQRPMWDMLSALFAARGLKYRGTKLFTRSHAGTVVVDAATGADKWSDDVNTGHYVLTDAASDELFSALFDGYAHDSGFLAADK